MDCETCESNLQVKLKSDKRLEDRKFVTYHSTVGYQKSRDTPSWRPHHVTKNWHYSTNIKDYDFKFERDVELLILYRIL